MTGAGAMRATLAAADVRSWDVFPALGAMARQDRPAWRTVEDRGMATIIRNAGIVPDQGRSRNQDDSDAGMILDQGAILDQTFAAAYGGRSPYDYGVSN